jgi:hypothetical protein
MGPVAIRLEDLVVVPFNAGEPETAGRRGRVATPLESLVMMKRGPLHQQETTIGVLSPAAAVAEVLGLSLDFHVARDRAVNALCRVLEQRPAAQVHYSRPHEAAALIDRWVDSRIEVAA